MDLTNFLGLLRPGFDVVVKASQSLPIAAEKSDVDIYSLDPEHLIARLNGHARETGVESRLSKRSPEHQHLDLTANNQLFVRFDIYSAVPKFRRFALRSDFFSSVVSSAEMRKAPRGGSAFLQPTKLHDALLRYVEYCEFYWVGPDKDHHLRWIESNLSADERSLLYEAVHVFVVPHYEEFSVAKRVSTLGQVFRFLGRWPRLRRWIPRRVVVYLRKFLRSN